MSIISFIKNNLFNNWYNSIISLFFIFLFFISFPKIVSWMFINSVVIPDYQLCRAAMGQGACWGFIVEKWKIIIFGWYPTKEIVRPIVGSAILLMSIFYIVIKKKFDLNCIYILTSSLVVSFYIVVGGFGILNSIPTNNIGGLFLTLFIGILANIFALPLAILLAFLRNSNSTILRFLSIGFIELFRGTPLIGILFIAWFVFPIFLPDSMTVDAFFRICIAFTLLSAAYQAEIIRGGLNAIPKDQIDSAKALNFSSYTIAKYIILPQVFIKIFIPLINQFISIMKDTTLVLIVGMFDLLGSLQLAFGDPQWRIFFIEGIIFVSIVYWLLSKIIVVYGERLKFKFKQEYNL